MTVELQHVGLRADGHQILVDVDLHMPAGAVTAIVGHSGAGKTTVARVAAGLVRPDTGSVASAPNIRRSMLLQRPEDMFMTDSVQDEVAYAPALDGLAGAEFDGRVTWALKAAGIADELRHADPLRLSGGTQRLVAMASVLSAGPDVLVLDEPTAGVDQPGRWRIIETLHGLRAEGVAIAVVTHDMRLIAAAADTVVVMQAGRVWHTAPADELLADPDALGRLELPVLAEVAAADLVAATAPQVPAMPDAYDADAMIAYVAAHAMPSAGGLA